MSGRSSRAGHENLAPSCPFRLFHGTTPENAERLLRDGWAPAAGMAGANRGQTRFLYLTTEPEDAAWFAEQQGSTAILTIKDVPATFLLTDPEDGMGDTPEEELEIALKTGLPAKLVLTRPLGPQHFSLFQA